MYNAIYLSINRVKSFEIAASFPPNPPDDTSSASVLIQFPWPVNKEGAI